MIYCRMRVALNGYFWNQPRTGSGQYLRHLWAALSELMPPSGHDEAADFSLLLPPGLRPNVPVPTPPGFDLHTARYSPAGGKSSNLDKVLWEEWSVVEHARRAGAGLLHTPYLSAPLRKRLPTVVTAHDMIPWVVPGYKGSLAVQLYLRLAVTGVRRADLILADSDASRRDVIRVLRVAPHKVRTVYLGMEPHAEYTRDELDEVRARMGLPSRFAFYMGGFDRRKNVPLLLHAWRRVVDTLAREEGGEAPLLAIGGDVPHAGGVFPDVTGVAATLGFEGQGAPVRFLGRISERDKPLLMASSRLFVYPSAYEGFGLDPLEAMSVGCPVVSSSGGSLVEVVGEGGLLVPPGDEEALMQALVHIWKDDAQRQELALRGKKQAARFTWRRTAEQTLAAYRVLSQKPQAGKLTR